MVLIMVILSFLSQKRIMARLERRIAFLLKSFVLFCYGFVHPVCVLHEKFEYCMNLLLITDENKK